GRTVIHVSMPVAHSAMGQSTFTHTKLGTNCIESDRQQSNSLVVRYDIGDPAAVRISVDLSRRARVARRRSSLQRRDDTYRRLAAVGATRVFPAASRNMCSIDSG